MQQSEENKLIVQFLRDMVASDPPPEIHARNPHWTPEVLMVAKAFLLSAAHSIEGGAHFLWANERNLRNDGA